MGPSFFDMCNCALDTLAAVTPTTLDCRANLFHGLRALRCGGESHNNRLIALNKGIGIENMAGQGRYSKGEIRREGELEKIFEAVVLAKSG
jgi:hypothetical protein